MCNPSSRSKCYLSSRIEPKAAFTYFFDNMGVVSSVQKRGDVFDGYGNGTQGLDTTYMYNDRVELTSEKTFLGGTGTALTGRTHTTTAGYTYDNIGNRTATNHNGDTATYTPDLLNRYTQRTVPGIFDVSGATSSSSVTVDGSSSGVVRHGDYFFKAHAMNNSSTPVYDDELEVDDGILAYDLTAFLPKTAEEFTYDLDGNLKSDGRWSYIYDAENRLIRMDTIGAAVTAGHPKVAYLFWYDYLGRRIRKLDYTWSGSAWVAGTDRRYVYEGWNLMAEYYGPYNAGNFPTANARHQTWGIDLSGSFQGAGGVGGLLMVREGGQSYLPAYDAMGNIHAMIKASDGSIAAAYEYDAFGKTLRETGPYAASNPFRFSTKYTDTETSLVYYGLRYYSPSMGRFINRDPIEEAGGLNLYGFVGNNAVNRYDYLGMMTPAWGNGDNWFMNPNTGLYEDQDPETGLFRSEFDAWYQESLLEAARQQQLEADIMMESGNPHYMPIPDNDHAAIMGFNNNLLAWGDSIANTPANGFNLFTALSGSSGGTPTVSFGQVALYDEAANGKFGAPNSALQQAQATAAQLGWNGFTSNLSESQQLYYGKTAADILALQAQGKDVSRLWQAVVNEVPGVITDSGGLMMSDGADAARSQFLQATVVAGATGVALGAIISSRVPNAIMPELNSASMQATLAQNGWNTVGSGVSKNGSFVRMQSGSTSITFYTSTSGGGVPTAQVFQNGQPTLKIRLGGSTPPAPTGRGGNP